MIAKPMKLWFFNEFSLQVPEGKYREEYGEDGYWCCKGFSLLISRDYKLLYKLFTVANLHYQLMNMKAILAVMNTT